VSVSNTIHTDSLLEAKTALNFHDIVYSYVTGHAFGGMSEGISVEKLCSQFSSVAKDLMYPRACKEDVKEIRDWLLLNQHRFLSSHQH
jgi:hypothetical protein